MQISENTHASAFLDFVSLVSLVSPDLDNAEEISGRQKSRHQFNDITHFEFAGDFLVTRGNAMLRKKPAREDSNLRPHGS